MRRPSSGASWLMEPLASRELAAFVAAVEAGTVQEAADVLCLTQSAATKRIQALERRLGVKLLVRSRSGVTPTEPGRLLYPEGRRALEALATGERLVASRRTALSLQIAASHTVGEFLLPGWLARLRLEAPDLHPQVDVINSPGVLAKLRGQEAEVGFVEGDNALGGLDCTVVATDEIVVVVSPDHRWRTRTTLRAEDLTQDAYITRELGSGTRAVAERRLSEAGVELTPDLQLASLEGVKRALPGGGFTLISQLAVQAETHSRTLHALRIHDASLQRQLVAVRLRGATAQAGAELFWSFLSRQPCLHAGDGGHSD